MAKLDLRTTYERGKECREACARLPVPRARPAKTKPKRGLRLAETYAQHGARCDTHPSAVPDARGVAASLRPVFEGNSMGEREFIVSEVFTTGRMLRTPEYKLVTYVGDETEQLFDMRKDLGETENLFGEARYADVHADMKKRLGDWESHLDPLSLKGRQPIRSGRRPQPQRPTR